MERESTKGSHGVLAAAGSQDLVAVYFQAKSSYWKEVYQESTLDGVVYRDRMALTLRWIEELRLPDGERVLDAGCGAGLTAVALARRGYEVDAIDAAQNMLELTRQLALEHGVQDQVSVQTGDAHQLPLSDNQFALVLALGLLPWMQEPGRAVREMARVLKPGGYLLVSADNRWCLNHLLDPGLNQAFSLPRRAWHKIRRMLAGTANAAKRPPVPAAVRHSIGTVDAWIRASGLAKIKGSTLGFGPFTWLGRRPLTDATGIEMHAQLQALADRNVFCFRLRGWHYLVLAQKPGGSGPLGQAQRPGNS